MLGAIIGDIAGSRFEWHNTHSKTFELFHPKCHFTDDSVITLAVAEALLLTRTCRERLPETTIACMQNFGRTHIKAGYGGRFLMWLASDHPQPYTSYGNDAAMRVSACGWVAASIDEAKALSHAVTAVTHNHPEGLKGAEAVAISVFLAKSGASRQIIRDTIVRDYYPLNFTLDAIRDTYTFDVSCQGSVPQALEAFFESSDFEDSIRNAISLGGDSDTIAAIAGSIAEAFYGIPTDLRAQAMDYLDEPLVETLFAFEERYPPREAPPPTNHSK